MTEARPRMTRAELEYLCNILRERELALRDLYEELIRKAIHSVATCPKGGGKLNLEESLLSLWRRHGERGLWHACSQFKFPGNAHLAEEIKDPLITKVSTEVWIAKGLRARFESLLKGKKKGRISRVSDMARDFLEHRKR